MITVYNKDYKDQYTTLFEDAYKVLLEMHAADPNGVQLSDSVVANGKISTLEEYFTHIGYLADYHTNNIQNNPPSNVTYQNSAKFLMLPMDEKHNSNDGDCFYIDLKSRNIKIPNSYVNNGVSVTGDQMAETLMFKVPRYFDYTDLAATEIYVQWTNPAGQEGASRIVLVDFEGEEGYVLFGWPLTNKITVEGKNPLKFSIRFFVRDGEKQIKYSLNTLPASVNIKQALYTEFNVNLDIDDPSLLFANAIRNGVDTNMVLPKIPVFFDDWSLPAKMYLNNNDTLEMVTAGTTEDTGMICYKWYYSPRYVDEDKNTITIGEEIGPLNMYAGIDTVYKPTKDKERKTGKTYYIEETEAGTGRKIYTIHDGPFVEAEDGEEPITYYEEVSAYNIYADSPDLKEIPPLHTGGIWPHVTGDYKVIITNKVGSNEPVEGKTIQRCTIPCIEEITFDPESKLKAHKVIETSNEGKQAILFVDFSSNEENIEKKYEWFKSETSDGEYIAIEGSTSQILTVDTPGFYKAKVTGTLNRESMYKWSEYCKVTNPIEAPTITKHLVDNVAIEDGSNGNGMIPLARPAGTEIDLGIDIEELSKLETDGVTYTWYRNTINSDGDGENGILVDPKTQNDVIAINNNHLIVKASGVDIYYCEITNKIEKYNGSDEDKTAITTSDAFYIAST